MCVAISGQDVLDYIFSRRTDKSLVSFDEMERFRKKFSQSLKVRASSNPYYATVLYMPLRDLSERCYDGILVRREDGIRLFGSIKENVAEEIQRRYNNPYVSEALEDAFKVVSEEAKTAGAAKLN